MQERHLGRFIEEQSQGGGFHSARNEFDVGKYLTKPSETVPLTNMVSRLESIAASPNRSRYNESAPHEMQQPISSELGQQVNQHDQFFKQPPSSPNRQNPGHPNDFLLDPCASHTGPTSL